MTTIGIYTALPEGVVMQRLEYTLAFIANHPATPDKVSIKLNCQEADINIVYGNIEKFGYLTMPFSGVCFFDKLNDQFSQKHTLFNYSTRKIGGFFSDQYNSPHYVVDVFETIFFHLSRIEEWFLNKQSLDSHGRFSTKDHFLVSSGLHETPVVDLLICYFFESLGLAPKSLLTGYSLTHDIDVIQKFPSLIKVLKSYANIVFYQKQKIYKLKKLTKIAFFYLSGKIKDPYDTFDWLLTVKSEKITSRIIYFLSGGHTRFEEFYNISQPESRDIIDFAVKNQYQLGIHPSYLSGKSLQMTESEKNRLEKTSGQSIKHSRQHFLRFFFPDTPEIVDKLGLKTDSSLGFSNLIGFRCGTGFPYHLYDFKKETAYSFLEIPLIVMDMALVHQHNADVPKMIKHLNQFLDKNKHFTQITFNFHNSTFDPTLLDSEMFKQYYLKLFNNPNPTDIS